METIDDDESNDAEESTVAKEIYQLVKGLVMIFSALLVLWIIY